MLKHIRTDQAPPPGFYSQGVVVDPSKCNILWTAGQTGNRPKDDKVENGLFNQTSRALGNLFAVIHEAGGKIEGIIKINVYLKDPQVSDDQKSEERKKMRKTFSDVYESAFRFSGIKEENLPARSLVWVGEVPLEAPTEDTLVEIEAVVAVPRV